MEEENRIEEVPEIVEDEDDKSSLGAVFIVLGILTWIGGAIITFAASVPLIEYGETAAGVALIIGPFISGLILFGMGRIINLLNAIIAKLNNLAK